MCGAGGCRVRGSSAGRGRENSLLESAVRKVEREKKLGGGTGVVCEVGSKDEEVKGEIRS